MPPVTQIFQGAQWPGILGIESLSYTCSHGITPGRAILVSVPQPNDSDDPSVYGDLTITDLVHPPRTVRRCKVDRLQCDITRAGKVWTLEILDRRWMFKPPGDNGLGAVRGRYNLKDTRGKLVPWAIRSPAELALLCLQAMGEKNFVVQLPPGIPRAMGANLDRFLKLGENFPQSLANPETIWDFTPPGEALTRLCDEFGYRLVFQPFSDRFIVVPLGVGKALPNYPFEAITPSIDSPETPISVGIAGAPVRIQARYRLEPVGKEWDGSYLPIADLSYKPGVAEGKPQISTVRYITGTPVSLIVTIQFKTAAGKNKFKQASDQQPGHGPDVRLATVAAQLMADPDVAAAVDVAAGSSAMQVTGKQNGFSFSLTAIGFDSPATDNRWSVELNQAADGGNDGGWKWSDPPTFSTVNPTAQLARVEAQALARESVFRCYRIMNVDVGTGKPPMVLPWFGPVKRRQQVVLQPTKVELVKPAPRIQGAVNKNNQLANIPGQGVLPEFYNGYARDQAATVRGSAYRMIQNVLWNVPTGNAAVDMNTKPTDRVFVEIVSIDPVEQVVTFAEPVYRWMMSGSTGWIEPPELVLETACLVQDAETNEIVRWTEELPLGGIAPTAWSQREDVQVGIIGLYGGKGDNQAALSSVYTSPSVGGGAGNVGADNPAVANFNVLNGWETADLADAKARAAYYLTGMSLKYVLTAGATIKYVGIYGIEPDGYVQQVTYSVGEGATTTASSNSEHSPVIPPYPTRRRAENLPPDSSARAANMAEREQVQKLIPRPKGAGGP